MYSAAIRWEIHRVSNVKKVDFLRPAVLQQKSYLLKMNGKFYRNYDTFPIQNLEYILVTTTEWHLNIQLALKKYGVHRQISFEHQIKSAKFEIKQG